MGAELKKILVISLAGIGDTLFATPVIHELRIHYPAAQIDALVLWTGSRDILGDNPHLDTVYQRNLITAPRIDSLKYLWRLRRQRYDLSINTYPQSRRHYRIVARMVGARLRLSHRYDHDGRVDRWLINQSSPQDYSRHAVENNLALLAHLNRTPQLPQHEYEISLTPAETKWAAEYLAKNNLEQFRLCGIHVGSGGTKNLALRRWPLSHYAELISGLLKAEPDVAVVLFGGPEEREAHAKLREGIHSPRLLQPDTRNIRQAAALVRHCRAFLSVDTALMHVAAAMKVPRQVVIETPSFNKTVAPYGRDYFLVKNPLLGGNNLDFYRYDGKGLRGSAAEISRCMASVSPDSVLTQLKVALA